MWVKNCIENTPFQLSGGYSMQCAPYYNRKRIADEHPPINERRCLMQFLTHIIFLLNLLKTLINHFS